MNYKILKEMYKIWLFDKIISILKNIWNIKISDIYNFYIAKINPNSKFKFLEDKFSWALEDKGWSLEILDWTEEEIEAINREELNLFDQSIEWRTRNACVPTNLYVQLCHNIGIVPEYKFWKALLLQLEKEGLWKENYWASIPKVANRLLEIWNKTNPNNKVKLLKKYHNFDLIEKWYLMTWGRNTFKMYSEDIVDNNNIDSKNYKNWTRAWWHCLNVWSWKIIRNMKQNYITAWEKRTRKNGLVEFDYTIAVNSYPKRHWKYNYYGHNLLKEHVENNIWYDYFYCYISDNKKIEEYKYFANDYKFLEDQENKDLFKVLQRALKETWYKPKNRTILWSNADRTNARIYTTIMLAREFETKN